MERQDEGISAGERAYREIRDGILEGRLRPGEMLGEASLAAGLRLSRTPVRTALARLQDEGWIVIYPKRGALVQGLSERALAEHAAARLVLESTGVERAAEPPRTGVADRLDLSIEEQRGAFDDRDLRRFIDLTLAFHRGFVEAGENTVLLELYDRLLDRQRFVLFATGDRLLARCEEIIEEHRTLVALLRAGDAGEFARMLRGHIAEAVPI